MLGGGVERERVWANVTGVALGKPSLMCLFYSWMEQPHLDRVTLIEMWSWEGLHFLGRFRNQGTQVKPAITTHNQEELYLQTSCQIQ